MPELKSDSAPSAGFIQAGLLLETTQQQQQLAAGVLARLEAWAGDLDEVLRDSVRQVLVQELTAAGNAARQADEALQRARRHASLRVGLWSLGLTTLCTALPAAMVWVWVPSRAQVLSLRQQSEDLAARVAHLKAQGGVVDLRRCGPAPQLCVRVDRKAPAYGEAADYFVIRDIR